MVYHSSQELHQQFLTLFGHEVFCSKLAKLNIRKSHGSDGITSKEMKIVSEEIALWHLKLKQNELRARQISKSVEDW